MTCLTQPRDPEPEFFLTLAIRRKILLISSLLFLFSSTELHELAKVPLLVKHFLHHRAEDPSMEIGSFLALHYSSQHPMDNDEEEDGSLPFKDLQTVHLDQAPVQLHYEKTAASFSSEMRVPHSMGRPLQNSSSIFRPPQMV